MKDRESSRMSHWSPDCKNRMEIKRWLPKAESFMAKTASAIVTSEEQPLYFHWMGWGAGGGPGVNGAESVLTAEVIYSFKYLGH